MVGLIRNHNGIVTPLHPSPPGSVNEDGPYADEEEHATDGGSDDVEVLADGIDGVPEAAFRLGHVLDEGKDLDDADEGGHKDGDACEDDGVVQNGDDVAGEGLGRVESHHEGAVGRVNEAHSGYG